MPPDATKEPENIPNINLKPQEAEVGGIAEVAPQNYTTTRLPRIEREHHEITIRHIHPRNNADSAQHHATRHNPHTYEGRS